MKKFLLFVIISVLLFQGCKKQENNNAENKNIEEPNIVTQMIILHEKVQSSEIITDDLKLQCKHFISRMIGSSYLNLNINQLEIEDISNDNSKEIIASIQYDSKYGKAGRLYLLYWNGNIYEDTFLTNEAVKNSISDNFAIVKFSNNKKDQIISWWPNGKGKITAYAQTWESNNKVCTIWTKNDIAEGTVELKDDSIQFLSNGKVVERYPNEIKSADNQGSNNPQKPSPSPTQNPAPNPTTPSQPIEKWPEAITGENSPNNVTNNQYFTKLGGWLYYYNAADRAIYKIRVDGTDKILLKKAELLSMMTWRDHIYIIYTNSNKEGIYRIDLSGKNESKVSNYIFPTDYCRNICSYGDSIYFDFNIGSMQRVNPLKNEYSYLTMQPTNIVDFGIWGKYMYYTNSFEDYNIYQMDLDTMNKVKLNDISSDYLNVYGSYIYFSNRDDEHKIYRTKIGGETEKFSDEKPIAMNIYNGWIYYSNREDGNKLYKMKTDGTGKTKICNDSAFHLNIVGDWIFYQTYAAKEVFVIKNDGSRKYKL